MSAEPKVFVGLPCYLYVMPHAMMGATCFASEVPGRCAVPRVIGGTGYCGNYNSLWCYALNTRKEVGWTHYACLHQDVQPQMWWVDRCLEIMQERDLDVLSVVLPIKNDDGMTSIGVLNKETLSTRRLSMKEIVRHLPKTFTSEDLPKLGYKNHLLMPMAGMFVARFDQPWVEKVWFESPSKIVQNVAGEFVSCIWDEGWNISIQMMQLGVKLGATRAVLANHLGNGIWGNEEEWGEWDTDASDMNQEWILGRA